MTQRPPRQHRFRLPAGAAGATRRGACARVFDSVADRYDLMNDLMSGGAHRLWKQFTLSLTGLKAGDSALDIAGGTGDLAAGLARQVGAAGLVVLADINASMLQHGRDRLIDRGVVAQRAVRAGQRRAPAVRRRQLRLRHDRLRPAQRHRQGRRAGLDAPRAQARRPAAGARILAAGDRRRSAACTTLYSFNLLPLARPRGRRRCRQLPLPGRIHPAPSGSADDCSS